MNEPLKTATLKNGVRITYSRYEKIEETHVAAGLKRNVIYQFERPGAGIIACIPDHRIRTLEDA